MGAGSRKDIARNLYVSGLSMEEIAARVGKCRATVFRYRSADAAKGIDWDRLRLQKSLGDEEFDNKHRVFLFALFGAFEKDLPALQEVSDPRERLGFLERYSNSYYKLMNAAKRDQPEVAVAEIVARTLEALARHAASVNENRVIEYLMDHLEEIKAAVQQEIR